MSLAKAMLSRVFSRESDDPLADVDPDADHIAYEEVVVRDVDPDRYPWGKTNTNAPAKGLMSDGYGFLLAEAYDEVEERIDDLEEHRGDVVAAVVADVDAWEYHVRMEVDR